jgi:hypothetical protein
MGFAFFAGIYFRETRKKFVYVSVINHFRHVETAAHRMQHRPRIAPKIFSVFVYVHDYNYFFN